MEKIYKNRRKFLLVVGFCLLFNSGVFAINTKQMINNVLAKYGISSGGKSICGTGKEAEYNKDTGIVKCKNDSIDDNNNCWDKDSRLCKECPSGTIVSGIDYVTCKQIVCPEGYELVEIKNNECPEGFELKEFSESCDGDSYGFDEIAATKNYTTQSTNCQNVKTK